MENEILVSVFMITYNHEQFIRQALDGILMQQCNFKYEIVVGEDCSTDNTRSILLEYKSKYPDQLNLLLHNKNIGAMNNQIATMEACKGKYIAICEGDDYWTDPLKLQKQVEALETNSLAVICFHKMKKLFQDGTTIPQDTSLFHKGINVRASIFSINYIATLTVMFRRERLNHVFFRHFYHLSMGDYPLYLSLLKKPTDQIIFIDEYMGIYRAGRSESISNTIDIEKHHLSLVESLLIVKRKVDNLSKVELGCIYNALSRENVNLYKNCMKKRKIIKAIYRSLLSIKYFFQSQMISADRSYYLLNFTGLFKNLKRGIKLLH